MNSCKLMKHQEWKKKFIFIEPFPWHRQSAIHKVRFPSPHDFSLAFISKSFKKKCGRLIWNVSFKSALLFNSTFISVLPLSSSVYVIHWASYGVIKTKKPKETFWLFKRSSISSMNTNLRLRFRQRIHVLKGEFASIGKYCIYYNSIADFFHSSGTQV